MPNEAAGAGLQVTFYQPARWYGGAVREEALREAGLRGGGVLVVLGVRGKGADDVGTLARVLRPRLVIFQRSVTEAAFSGQSAAWARALALDVYVLATEGAGTLRVEVDRGGLAVRRWSDGRWTAETRTGDE